MLNAAVTFHYEDTNNWVYLRLENGWKLTPGIGPNINTAEVPWMEYDRLGSDPARVGTVQFWATNKPVRGEFLPASDVTLTNIKIVEAEALEIGVTMQGVRRVVKYRLYLADRRANLIWPKGGHLRLGVVNGKDEATPKTYRQCVFVCLRAMGIEEITDDSAAIWPANPPRDLNWTANHAPTELGSLLEKARMVFYVKPDGTFGIDSMGAGTVPTIPAGKGLPFVDLPGIDRRPRTIVIDSAPTPMLDHVRLEGVTWRTHPLNPAVDPPELEFVSPDYTQNAQGRLVMSWQPMGAVLAGTYDTEAKRLGIVWRRWRDVVERQDMVEGRWVDVMAAMKLYWYRAIRISGVRVKWSPTLSKLPGGFKEKWGGNEGYQIMAKIAAPSTDGQWRNRWVRLSPTHLMADSSGTILVFPQHLLKFASDGMEHSDPVGAQLLTELGTGDVVLKVWIEQRTTREGKDAAVFFERGYSIESGAFRKLTNAELANVTARPAESGVVRLSDPSIRAFSIDGVLEATTLALCEAQAEALARANMPGGERPEERAAMGFVPGTLSGRVAEIEYQQGPPKTMFRLNTWHFPAAEYEPWQPPAARGAHAL